MFSLLNGIYDSYLAPTQLNLLVVGGPLVGKTALLERLKVTDIPTRSKGGSKAMSERMAAEELTPTLMTALAETGAVHVRRMLVQNKERQQEELARHFFSTNASGRASAAASSQSNAQEISGAAGSGLTTTVKVKQKRRFSFCPAPERYLKSTQDEDEVSLEDKDGGDGPERTKLLAANNNNDDDDGGNNTSSTTTRGWEQELKNENNDETASVTSDAPQRVRCHSKELDMESLDLMDGRRSSMQEIPLDQPLSEIRTVESNARSQVLRRRNSNDSDTEPPLLQTRTRTTTEVLPQKRPSKPAVPQSPPAPKLPTDPPLRQSSSEEYNVKPKGIMLPLRMIRPTIGTNLKKIDMYGAQCHCFDVGGRLQDLWERYYEDCDAVIFCWRLGDDPDDLFAMKGGNDDSDEDGDDPTEVYKKQQEILNQVRKSIPDDIPFLIFGHVFGNANVELTDRMFSTDLLLPHYHNPMTSMCCGSAKTGAGVQSAMDWLIPLAKRQQKERQQTRQQAEEKEI